MSETQKLVERLKRLTEDGLVDVKMSLSNAAKATVEGVCREINEMLDGPKQELDFKDSTLSTEPVNVQFVALKEGWGYSIHYWGGQSKLKDVDGVAPSLKEAMSQVSKILGHNK